MYVDIFFHEKRQLCCEIEDFRRNSKLCVMQLFNIIDGTDIKKQKAYRSTIIVPSVFFVVCLGMLGGSFVNLRCEPLRRLACAVNRQFIKHLKRDGRFSLEVHVCKQAACDITSIDIR